MSDKRTLRVFCPTHEAAFEVADSPKILCEITEHALSVGFPSSEYWEFCCNCETFTPSKLDKGEKARKVCYGCGNEIAKRFVCADCKTVSFECDAHTKGKSYTVNADGIEPACPGCQTVLQGGKSVLHRCGEIEADIFTARLDCPFCLEKTVVVSAEEKTVSAASAMQFCPHCRAENAPGAVFCGKCRHQLRDDVEVANLGTDIYKTQLLGSLCPNCSTLIPSDSDFCGECGQAVQKVVVPPPPPPPSPMNTYDNTIQSFGGVPNNENFPQTKKKDNTAKILVGAGAGILLLVIFSSIISSNKNSSVLTNTNSLYSGNTASKNGSNRAAVSISKTPNNSSSDNRIGKTGTLTRDANLREAASKDSYLAGTQYRGAKITILDVKTVPNSLGGTTDWYKIEVTAYGSSMDPGKFGQSGKDPGSEDVGWVNSYPEVYEGNRKIRVTLIDFD